VVLEVRDSSILVTVMPIDAPPYRARVPVPADGRRSDVRIGSHLELVVGAEPGEVRLAEQPPPAA
jgi:hypothetical protein